MRLKRFMDALKKSHHFLVYTGTLETDGIYVIADPLLKGDTEAIKSLLRGYSIMPLDGSLQITKNHNSITKYIILCAIKEPLAWEGDIVEISIPYSPMDVKPGKIRVVSEGGTGNLKVAHDRLTALTKSKDIFDNVTEPVSSLPNVNQELAKMRKMLFRIAVAVIDDLQRFRYMFKTHPEVVQNLFVFAREFGQRGINIMNGSRRGHLAIRLINMCIEWLSFNCDDCEPSDPKVFRWTVLAIEFTMVMTRGVNIVAITDEQFTKLRMKVAGCMSLLISHFDIMGARSRAQRSQLVLKREEKQNTPEIKEKDDVQLIQEFHLHVMKSLEALEANMKSEKNMGKVIDETDDNAELLTFLSSNFVHSSFRWQQGRFIGGGSFGSVYAAVDLDSGSVMAVKEIRMQDAQSMKQVLKSIKDEMTVLEMLRHPNIVEYRGVEVHRDRVFIFMEYCQGGSLAKQLEYGRIEEENVIQVYTVQMLEGLSYLHGKGVIHRDIKPENILLDHNGVIKFVDFGAAKVIATSGRTRRGGVGSASIQPNTDDAKLNSLTGTPMYMSPEVITGATGGTESSKIDIWSLGCCVLEMATGRRPWANLDNEWAIMYHIAAGQQPAFPTSEQLSPFGLRFLQRALEINPVKRPSATELLEDQWVINIRKPINTEVGSV